ncbi:MAG TPA: PAS domain-containing sensor histidine kinase [Polyangiaceae bacterium]
MESLARSPTGSTRRIPANIEQQFRLFIEGVGDYAIFMLDTEGRIVTWNLGAERIKGYRADEIIGQHFSAFYPAAEVSEAKPQRELQEATRVGRFEDEGWRIRKDGSRFWANVVITAVRDEDGTLLGFGKVTRDLTARREAEETALQLASEQAARAEAEKAETFQRNMLAIVSHDLRNCLSVLVTAGEMIRQQPQAAPEKVARRASQVVTSARRMQEIIRTLIDYTYTQRPSGIPVALRDGVSFHEVCVQIIEEAKIVHPSRQIFYEGEGDPTGHWDEGRLGQVVQNLLGNALKYGSPLSPVSVRWWREGGDPERGEDLVLTVENEGKPIPSTLLPHVFEPFRSGGGAPTAAKDSMGLGLFIVREIVKAHGGTVDVRSDPSSTTFTVRLPPSACRPGDASGGTPLIH